MKIAVTYDNGTVYQHFGHTKQFKIYTVEDNKVVSSENRDTVTGHARLAGF
ncbi:MAG: NifB/NifX family molybdenum-iron cluster-binding protein [[Clostridium] leptum]